MLEVIDSECNLFLMRRETDEPKQSRNMYVTVMPLMNCSLQDKIDYFPFLSIEAVRKVTIQLLLALKSVHDQGFVHCNLSPSNILIKEVGFEYEDGNVIKTYGQSHLKLSNFNYSQNLNRDDLELVREEDFWFKGCPNYLSRAAHEAVKMTKMDDLESLVYLVIKLTSGELPWQGI